MSFPTLLLLALGLAMDAFAVAAAAGAALQRPSPRQYFRLAWHFGLFQALMPAAGWLGGSLAQRFVAAHAPLVALLVLAGIGGHMIWESFHHDEDAVCADPTAGTRLIALSLATSIDALAAGVTLAVLDAAILVPCLVIGATAAALTAAGLFLGAQAGCRLPLGRLAERLGGVVLVLLGLKMWWAG